jgi:choline dehydrogenase-like flavoprotein
VEGSYDVIGSGGGGTLVRRLAPSGKRILLLERGDWRPREPQNWSAQDVSSPTSAACVAGACECWGHGPPPGSAPGRAGFSRASCRALTRPPAMRGHLHGSRHLAS